MKKIILIILVIFVIGFGTWFLARGVFSYRAGAEERGAAKAANEAIEKILESRRGEMEKNGTADPFGEDGVVHVLLLGLDRRTGEVDGHCDAIQFITIDSKKQEVEITAVPRGTYSPLPPGGKYLPSDYYVSKSCAIGGLGYGIDQIEKILGTKADYLIVLGFSEALGIFRDLGLPTTETLEWLRHRQGYAIGEPQRAHNHSTFIKQMMIKYIPKENSVMAKALQYIIYKTVQTDLSFAEARKIIEALSAMDFSDNSERIHLLMKPAYVVQDIPYAEEYLGEYLDKMIKPIKDLLPGGDYSGLSEEELQTKLLEIINEKKNDPEFISWAFENNLWLQIEDKEKRLAVQYDILSAYAPSLSEKSERESILADYILEMENYGETAWAERGRDLLGKELDQ
jgi:anionic cell wall polymer biosynthesis LytR-Cps2A-Psr (LCP) family protein